MHKIIIEKVSTAPTTRQKKVDTSAAMEIGMAAKERSMDIALQAVYKGTGKGNWASGKGPSKNTERYAGGKGGKDANREGKRPWQKRQRQERRQRNRGRWRTHCSFVSNRRSSCGVWWKRANMTKTEESRAKQEGEVGVFTGA